MCFTEFINGTSSLSLHPKNSDMTVGCMITQKKKKKVMEKPTVNAA